MLIKLDGKVLKMKWIHEQYDLEMKTCLKQNGTTACIISSLDDSATFIGEARCSAKDQYRKSTGRVISTNRAAQNFAQWYGRSAEEQQNIINEILKQYENR
jgi:hypothetical protein